MLTAACIKNSVLFCLFMRDFKCHDNSEKEEENNEWPHQENGE